MHKHKCFNIINPDFAKKKVLKNILFNSCQATVASSPQGVGVSCVYSKDGQNKETYFLFKIFLG